ncbi:MAG: hypothetical protein H6961_10345 [Chromatiaceae bacterium]|nr:hypothetical protein [Chromatiaceae bacterium]
MPPTDETARILYEIKTHLGQIESSVTQLQTDVQKMSGGLAVVLSHTQENREQINGLSDDIEAIFAELENSKKKQRIYKKKYNGLSNISLGDLQKTMSILQNWRRQRL